MDCSLADRQPTTSSTSTTTTQQSLSTAKAAHQQQQQQQYSILKYQHQSAVQSLDETVSFFLLKNIKMHFCLFKKFSLIFLIFT